MPSSAVTSVLVKRSRIYRPTIRCIHCRRIRLFDGIKAWFLQPPWPTSGRGDTAGPLRFICAGCLLEQRRRR